MALLTPTPYSFSPTVGTAGTGSYNTQDWLSLLTGLTTGGVAGTGAAAGINEQIGRLRSLGSSAASDYANLAQQVTQGTQFTPYTLTNALGSVQQTAPGVISQELTPQQQANVNAASAMQGSLYGAAVPNTTAIQNQAFGGVGGYLSPQDNAQLLNLSGMFGNIAQQTGAALPASTQDMANTLFQQQQAMVTPEQQRQQLELENRLRAQGRLGTTTAAYGGTPEQLAMAKAIEEQRAANAYGALTNAEAMATSQQNRAISGAQASSALQQANQALKQGDIQTAASLFNIGSSAAQLPGAIQAQNVSTAGALQGQALAPSAQQLSQAQLAAQLGQQNAAANIAAGGLFGNLASTGLQEQLTAETAAAALRGKQYEAQLSALASKGGQTGTAANTVQNLLNQGIQKVGGNLVDATGKVLGKAVDLIGDTASNLWNELTNGVGSTLGPDNIDIGGGWNPAGLASVTTDTPNLIEEGWNTVKSWFGF